MASTRAIKKWPKRMAGLAFGWVMLDALLNYFLDTFLGTTLQVTAILPLFLMLIIFGSGWRVVLPPAAITLTLVFAVIGFALGPILVAEIPVNRYFELAGAICAFAIGYSYMWTHEDENVFSRLVLLVCGLYVAVCMLALLKVAPNIFPVASQPWSYNGLTVFRPYVGINSNFQVFYVFPVVLILALPYQFCRFWSSFVLTLSGIVVLAKLQTRSGSLALVGTVLVCFLVPLWDRQLGRQKSLMIALAFLSVVAIGLPWMIQSGDLLIARFTDTDYGTGYGRLIGFTYLFDHLIDPTWWSPRGNLEFAQRYGGTDSSVVPHSNITAMFLEGGITGLFMWIIVFLVPLLRLVGMFFGRRLDPLATMVMIGGLTMIVVQLTLNVPFFKQPWLWAGAVVGTLYRSRASAFSGLTGSARGGAGNSDRSISGSLAQPKPCSVRPTEEQAHEKDAKESRTRLQGPSGLGRDSGRQDTGGVG